MVGELYLYIVRNPEGNLGDSMWLTSQENCGKTKTNNIR